MITYHPETLSGSDSLVCLQNLTDALEMFLDYKIIITQANSDAGGRLINEYWEQFAMANSERVLCVKSLGQLRYLSAMKACSAVVGNSSSGILEAPVLKVPTVNIGDRQKGRKRYPSVVDCISEKDAIVSAIQLVIDKEFKNRMSKFKVSHSDGKIASNIKDILKAAELNGICKKEFHDLE